MVVMSILCLIDDSFRFGYLYLMKVKSKTFGKFLEYRVEVEKLLRKKKSSVFYQIEEENTLVKSPLVYDTNSYMQKKKKKVTNSIAEKRN